MFDMHSGAIHFIKILNSHIKRYEPNIYVIDKFISIIYPWCGIILSRNWLKNIYIVNKSSPLTIYVYVVVVKAFFCSWSFLKFPCVLYSDILWNSDWSVFVICHSNPSVLGSGGIANFRNDFGGKEQIKLECMCYHALLHLYIFSP